MPPKFLIVPGDARSELEALLQLDAAQLRKLRGILSDKGTLKEGRGYWRIARELGIGNEQALKVISASRNVRSQKERFELSDENLLEDLNALTPLTPSSVPLDDERGKALLELFGKSDDDYFINKVTSLKQALAPRLVDARTIVDARPVFDKEKSKIDGFLLVTYLELTAHHPDSDGYMTTSLSLTRKDIADLQARLKEAEAKLEALEAALPPLDVFDS